MARPKAEKAAHSEDVEKTVEIDAADIPTRELNDHLRDLMNAGIRRL